MPAATQTHEVVQLTPELLLISQQPSGTLVKISLDAAGRPLEAVSHIIDHPCSGIHGLAVSHQHPGCVWVTLQFVSQLLLIDPVGNDLLAPPIVMQRITLPAPARGPHVVCEDGDILWVTCKDSHHIVQINTQDLTKMRAIPCPPRPIFVQIHPTSKDIYVTLDQANAIFRIPSSPDAGPSVIPIPPQYGTTPVGMAPGPDGSLWFTLLGSAAGGSAGFSRILANSRFDWFQLTSGPAVDAGFIHLGFSPPSDMAESDDWDKLDGFDRSQKNECAIYLLASSMAAPAALNAVIQVRMNRDYSRLEAQQTLAFPTQRSMAHRVLCTPNGIYATQLATCNLVHLRVARLPWGEGLNEAGDPYAVWGCGAAETTLRYPVEDED